MIKYNQQAIQILYVKFVNVVSVTCTAVNGTELGVRDPYMVPCGNEKCMCTRFNNSYY